MKYSCSVMIMLCVNLVVLVKESFAITLTSYHSDSYYGNISTELGEKDGIVIVDMWKTVICPSTNAQLELLATKINSLLELARARNVKIFHALSGSDEHNYYANLLQTNFWKRERPSKMATESRGWLRDNLQLLEEESVKCPLDLVDPERANTIYCNDSRWLHPEFRLHPNIHLNKTYDIMFDDKFVFDKILDTGVKRLFYVGIYLNRCVLYARTFSSMAAISAGKFIQVGIIVDNTLPLLRRRMVPMPLRGISDTEVVDKFVSWMDRVAKLPKFRLYKLKPGDLPDD
jgi:hypothetical protein